MFLRSAILIPVLLLAASAAPCQEESGVPKDWLPRWNSPPPADRPMLIVHGFAKDRASVEGMKYYVERGLGGFATNVSFKDYMRSEENWKILSDAVDACAKLGLVVWVYDEDGYPSGAAGGLVLEADKKYEARALAYDRTLKNPFVIRPSYEHTHASNNYYAARRYGNLIDPEAMRTFVRVTHETYWKRLEPHFGKTIVAFFTDEPSLMAVNIGPLPEHVRKNVRVADPLDPKVQPLPSVPWCDDLPERYKERYNEDLLEVRPSLFGGAEARDREVRRRFWSLISDLITERYFGCIQDWCREHKVASSGHSLWEEQILHHVPLEGNGLKVLGRMDIPGLDVLDSNPESVIYGGWLTAGLPLSAALLNGRRRVMTEVSDFAQKMAKHGPADLDRMRATAAWQAAWGVTEFTLYYGVGDRPAEEFRGYCDFVGRLNSVLRDAQPDPDVLLYYPIHDLWAEYIPVAEKMTLENQSERARQIVHSFHDLGRRLQRSQIPFCVVDHEKLSSARVLEEGMLKIAGGRYSCLVLPDGVELPEGARKAVDRFRNARGRVLTSRDVGTTPADAVRPLHRITKASEKIALGRFLRDGRRILLVVNVGTESYSGAVTAEGRHAGWEAMDPATGGTRSLDSDESGVIPCELQPRQSLLFVSAPLKK